MNKSIASLNLIMSLTLYLILGTNLGVNAANDNVYFLIDKANREFIAHHPRPAIAYALQAVKVAPNNYDANKMLGYIYFNVDMIDEAIPPLSTALRISPKTTDSVVYVQLGKAYFLKQRNADAIRVFSQGITNVKDNSELLNERGAVYSLELQFDKAIADMSEAIKKRPTYAHYYNERAIVYMHSKQYANAVADYTSLLKYEPNSPIVYAERARAYKAMGKMDLAQKDLSKSNEISIMGQ